MLYRIAREILLNPLTLLLTTGDTAPQVHVGSNQVLMVLKAPPSPYLLTSGGEHKAQCVLFFFHCVINNAIKDSVSAVFKIWTQIHRCIHLKES